MDRQTDRQTDGGSTASSRALSPMYSHLCEPAFNFLEFFFSYV